MRGADVRDYKKRRLLFVSVVRQSLIEKQQTVMNRAAASLIQQTQQKQRRDKPNEVYTPTAVPESSSTQILTHTMMTNTTDITVL